MEQGILKEILGKLGGIEAQIVGIETRMDKLEAELTDVKGTVGAIDRHVVTIEEKVKKIDLIHENIVPNQKTIGKNTARIEKLEEVSNIHEAQIRGLKDRVNAL